MSIISEFVLMLIAVLCGVTATMTITILASPWSNLDMRLMAISLMALAISVLTLWIGLSVT
jgi:hypothetical protein